MSPLHPEAASFDGYDDLDPSARESLLSHAAQCAECRRRLLAADTARAFAFLGFESLPEASLARVSEAVRSLTAAPGAGAQPRGGRMAWASIAASLLLAAALGGVVLRRPHEVAAPALGAAVEAARARPAGTVRDALPGGIELLSPAGAEVYDLSVGDAQVVMIFDAELDI